MNTVGRNPEATPVTDPIKAVPLVEDVPANARPRDLTRRRHSFWLELHDGTLEPDGRLRYRNIAQIAWMFRASITAVRDGIEKARAARDASASQSAPDTRTVSPGVGGGPGIRGLEFGACQ
jgi:hypothetical protein